MTKLGLIGLVLVACAAVFANGLSARPVSCPDRPMYKVVSSDGLNDIVSELYLRIPMTRLNLPWTQLTGRIASDDADAALNELLKAIYDKNYAAAKHRINVDWATKSFGSAQSYLDAFSSSLSNAGQLTVYARVDGTGIVRFILQGEKEKSSRVLTFRRGAAKNYVFDESQAATPVEQLELTIFGWPGTPGLEVKTKELDRRLSIALSPGDKSCGADLIVKTERASALLKERNHAMRHPAANFYRRCYYALLDGRVRDYFSCFGPEVGAEYRNGFEKLGLDERKKFVQQELNREPAFLLDGGQIIVLFYRPKGENIDTHMSQQVILSKGASFELVNSLKRNPLYELLNDSEFQATLRRAAVPVEAE